MTSRPSDWTLRHAERFWTSVRTLVAGGCAVLLTTHYLEEADAVADRIVILDGGKVVRDGSPRLIKRDVPSRRIRCTTTLDVDGFAPYMASAPRIATTMES